MPEKRPDANFFRAQTPLCALAPMQDITGLPFVGEIVRRGAPDFFVTEYFRVHETSAPEAPLLRLLDARPGERPFFAQILGEDIPSILRTMDALCAHPIAGFDLNLGCPAPKVFRKSVGGGLLRKIDKIERILSAMRAHWGGLLTVKTRLGFESPAEVLPLMDLFKSAGVDAVCLHARTVKQLYRGKPDWAAAAQAAARLGEIPLTLNGDIHSAPEAFRLLKETGAAHVMMGRPAVRNPWIFRQFDQLRKGKEPCRPTLGEVRSYIQDLWEKATPVAKWRSGHVPESARLGKLKKFLNFVGQGIDPQGEFLRQMRPLQSPAALFALCDRFLTENGRGALPFAQEPYPGLLARPNCEGEPPTGRS